MIRYNCPVIRATGTSFLRLPFRVTKAHTPAPRRIYRRPSPPWMARRRRSCPTIFPAMSHRRPPTIHHRWRRPCRGTVLSTPPGGYCTTAILNATRRAATARARRSASLVKIIVSISEYIDLELAIRKTNDCFVFTENFQALFKV